MASQYANIGRLQEFGLAGSGLASIPNDAKNRALQAASATADGYLQARYPLPLTAWELDLEDAVCAIATFRILSAHGYRQSGETDKNVKIRYDLAIAWLESIAAGLITPVGIIDASGNDGSGASGGVAVVTTQPRGWTTRKRVGDMEPW